MEITEVFAGTTWKVGATPFRIVRTDERGRPDRDGSHWTVIDKFGSRAIRDRFSGALDWVKDWVRKG